MSWRTRKRGTSRQRGVVFKTKRKEQTLGSLKLHSSSKSVKVIHKQPRTAKEATKMIAKGEIPVTGSLELQNEYNSVNKQHFNGKLKDVTIMRANLSLVKHKAFAIPDANIILINTAKTPTLEEQKYVMRHEMIHIAGYHSHDFRFEMIANRIDAPVAEYEGKLITRQESDDLKVRRAVERAGMEQEAREKRMGMKKGEGELMRNGKPVARVIAYETKSGISTRTIHDISDIPKSSKTVLITTFDKLGYPKGKATTVSREELNNYTL